MATSIVLTETTMALAIDAAVVAVPMPDCVGNQTAASLRDQASAMQPAGAAC